MAGFYGRTTYGLPAPLTPDKIYSNRVNMRDNAKTDGVWAGRYVLVSYHELDTVELEANSEYYQNVTYDPQDNHPIYDEQEIYNKNYLKDKNNGYPKLGNGYDATVWRKVIDRKGNHTYVMLAELNAAIPTFDLVAEAPSNRPIAPYISQEDLTNVYYPLHIAANWGFKIAEAKYYDSDTQQWKDMNQSDTDYEVIKYDPVIQGDSVIQIPTTYQGLIYFNRQGFNKLITHPDTYKFKNEISLTPVMSGQTYGSENQAGFDTQELRVILPALGDAVSDMYDLMYGISTETPQKIRYTDTAWDDANARNRENRITTRALTYYKNPDGATRDGFTPTEAWSLAGTINSVHDMLGMIITASERPEDANDAYADQIYYVGYQVTDDDEFDSRKTYYKYNNNIHDYTVYHHDGGTWDKNNIYEFINKYYCVAESPQYQDPIEFETGDFSLTPVAFKNKYKDSEIAYPNPAGADYTKPALTKYEGGKYLKTDDTPTFTIAEAPRTSYGGAEAGLTYYNLPTTLTYAGRMVTTKDNTYYSITGGTSGKDVVPDENGSWVIRVQDDVLLYQIQPNTEFYHANEHYWALNEDQTAYERVNDISASNFENYVSNGLYRNGEMSVKLIASNSLGSTGFKVHYTTTSGQHRLQDVQGLAGGNGAYRAALVSEVAFVDFIRTSMQAIPNVQSVDYDYLYIDNGLEPDGQGSYANNYRPYPISKFLFADLDSSNSSYYANVYRRNNTIFERAQIFQSDNAGDTTIYRLSFSQETLFNGGWCIQASADQMDELYTKRRNQVLTSIQTADYDISTIYWSNVFNPNAIYWLIDGNEAAFTVAGYAISSTNTPEDEVKEASGKPIYYAPNVLYYKDEADEYILADDNYVYDGHTTLYRINELIIVDRGDLDQLRVYSKWDNNLIQTTSDISFFFKPVAEGGHGVKIAHKYIGAVWKEMPGFARNLNTIHGWMVRLNQLFNTSDVRSRDLNTYQGCVNTVKDILARFGDFTPGGYLQVNKYGQVETVSVVTPDISGALSTVSASFSQTTTDGLHLALTQSNGVVTAFNGSIGAITYTPTVDDGEGGYEPSATTSTMTLAAALAKISELELRIQALENA